ncbi:hypothetical protein MSAS_10520 [Mycobacterium saskatchewanense]|nr:hypothetical protein MSAS_10520 [Mycobacterium saskatchewanense]
MPALSGVAPSTRLTLSVPGTFGSASRVSTALRASGPGSGAVGGAATGIEVAGGAGAVGDDAILGLLAEHPASATAATVAAAISVADECRGIRTVSQVTGG